MNNTLQCNTIKLTISPGNPLLPVDPGSPGGPCNRFKSTITFHISNSYALLGILKYFRKKLGVRSLITLKQCQKPSHRAKSLIRIIIKSFSTSRQSQDLTPRGLNFERYWGFELKRFCFPLVKMAIVSATVPGK